MSAQATAKAAQGYQAKPVPSVCGNCAHFTTELVLPKWMSDRNAALAADGHRISYSDEYKREKNLRCAIGNFAVKKSATCDQFTPKVAP